MRAVSWSDMDALDESAFGPIRGREQRELREASDRAQAHAFGREPASGTGEDEPLRRFFTACGFDDAGVEECVHRARDPRFYGLQDVVGSMLTFDTQRVHARVTPMRVAEALRTVAVPQPVVERRTAGQARPRLIEAASATRSGDARFSVCLITTGQGSSGFYPATTLQEAAKAKVFPAGLHCYLDHPTESETYERPVRSVRDLAGALESDAVYRDGALYAEVTVFSTYADFIAERASVIGMSIRGDAEFKESSSQGQVVQRITRAYSVDFVTQAGRGGRVLGQL
jgi:hypothetical protein